MSIFPNAERTDSWTMLGIAIFWLLAIFYAFGASVHFANIAGLSGFEWADSPLKWRVLDVFYLALDVFVCIGLILRLPSAVIGFYIAAISQIILYTLFREWITDVPEPFTLTPEQQSSLTGMVVFHAVTIVLLSLAVFRWSVLK